MARPLRVIPINELKFALRSPVIGVSILQPSGRRQILIPLEPFVPVDFIASVFARYSRRVVHIIFAANQHSVTIVRSTRELTDPDKTSFTDQDRIMIRESTRRFKTPTSTTRREVSTPRIPEEITSYKLRSTYKLQRFNTGLHARSFASRAHSSFHRNSCLYCDISGCTAKSRDNYVNGVATRGTLRMIIAAGKTRSRSRSYKTGMREFRRALFLSYKLKSSENSLG